MPTTYGVPNCSRSVFAAGSPTEDTTTLTSASPARAISSGLLPMAKVLMISQSWASKKARMEDRVPLMEKSSGVTPSRLIFRRGGLESEASANSTVLSGGSATMDRATASSAIPAPCT